MSKSNRYRIVRKGTHWGLATTPAVHRMQEELIVRARAAMAGSGHTVAWEIRPGTRSPRAVNPYFPDPVEVDVRYRRPGRAGSDADGILKALADALTTAGVWPDDDHHVRGWHVRLILNPDFKETVVIIRIYPYYSVRAPLPSPLRRSEWIEQHKADASLHLPSPQVATYCTSCEIGIGPNCQEEEVWLAPVVKGRITTFVVLCGTCADEQELPFTHRVITREGMRELDHHRNEATERIATLREELKRAYRHDRKLAGGSSGRPGRGLPILPV